MDTNKIIRRPKKEKIVKTAKLSGLILGALIALALAVPATRASEWNEATKFTFSQPVQVPGQVLPAGTYWFETVQTPTDANNVVVIYNADRSQAEATVLTQATYRTHGISKARVTLGEQSGNKPPELMAWFYPGRTYGHAFVYSGNTSNR
jgi:hypothetical protein